MTSENIIIENSAFSLTLGTDCVAYSLIEKKTGIKTFVAEESLNCVALGTGEALTHMDILSQNGYVFKARDEIGGLTPELTE